MVSYKHVTCCQFLQMRNFLCICKGIISLGRVCFHLGQYEKAETELRKAWTMIESAFLTEHQIACYGKKIKWHSTRLMYVAQSNRILIAYYKNACQSRRQAPEL